MVIAHLPVPLLLQLAAGASITGSIAISALTDAQKKRLRHDTDLLNGGIFTEVSEHKIAAAVIAAAGAMEDLDQGNLVSVEVKPTAHEGTQIRRLTRKETNGDLTVVFAHTGSMTVGSINGTRTVEFACERRIDYWWSNRRSCWYDSLGS